MARTADPIFYEASGRFVEHALKADDSIFTPGRPVWTIATLDDFFERCFKTEDVSDASFIEKLSGELAGAPRDTCQLAAELLWVHLFATKNMAATSKRALIDGALDESPEDIPLPDFAVDVLDHAMAYSGMGMLLHRYWMVKFLFDFVRAWKALSEHERSAALGDPWSFKHFLFGLDCSKAASQREALLHMVHPDTFEPIVSKEDSFEHALIRGSARRAPLSGAAQGSDRQELHAGREVISCRSRSAANAREALMSSRSRSGSSARISSSVIPEAR